MEIKEIELHPDYDHSQNHSSVWHPKWKFDDPKWKHENVKQVGKVKGYSIILAKKKYINHIYVLDPKTRQVMLHVDGHFKGKAFYIGTLSGRVGSPVKAAEFYRALTVMYGYILVTDSQSIGGLKVWQKLASYPDVTVFGYNKGKTYNVDPREPEDTHVSQDEISDLDNNIYGGDEGWAPDYKFDPKEHKVKKNEIKDLMEIIDMKLVAHKKIGKTK